MHTWYAEDQEAFCLAVIRSYPRADIHPNASYSDLVRWLAGDLIKLEIDDNEPA